jgi:hypothetical protein
MNTRLKKIRCVHPYHDQGDRIKIELIDDPDSQSFNPEKIFRSNDAMEISLSVPVHGQDAKIIIVMESNAMIEEHIRTAHTDGEKTKTLQKDAAIYEITYEIN